MRIFLKDQRQNLTRHLEHMRNLPLTSYDLASLKEKLTAVPIHSPLSFAQINTGVLFSYQIFPRYVMEHLTEWELNGREMQVGDSIVQLVYLPPLGPRSLKIIVGVRIEEIINERSRIGFRYDTIEGHIEQGRATFTLERNPDHGLQFKIHTFSKPSNILARLVGPIFSVPYQTFMTKLALSNVKRNLESQTTNTQ